MTLINDASNFIADLTRDQPSFLHFDLLGFIRIADNGGSHLDALNRLLRDIGSKGGNLFIPSYSYSYTKNEAYSIKDSKCDLGRVFDYLRKNNYENRTSDAIFSYLSFGNWISNKFFLPKDYESFGDNSLIAEVFNNDGLLISVGNRLHYSTEIHYLERLLEVPYRIDKDFPGSILMPDGKQYDQVITFFCRDLEFAAKHNVTVSFERLFDDLDRMGKIQRHLVGNDLLIESVRFQEILSFLKKKIKQDIFYLMEVQ